MSCGRRAGQALEAARRDLAAGPLPDVIAKRTKVTVAPTFHPFALRALNRAMHAALAHAPASTRPASRGRSRCSAPSVRSGTRPSSGSASVATATASKVTRGSS